jgi:membrane-associated phospholipid phosphatase
MAIADTAAPALAPAVYARYTARLMHLWHYKAAGTATFMAVFFYSYFQILQTPVHAVTTMPVTWLDDAIAFWPPAFYIYASLWLYTALVPALQPDLKRLLAYGCGIGTLCLTGLVLFTFFPTAVPYALTDWFADPSLALLRQIDLAGNACPSLHVATAVFSAICLHQLLLELGSSRALRVANWLWCAAIIYSTLAIKQHVVWDVVAGALLALLAGWIYPYFVRRVR